MPQNPNIPTGIIKVPDVIGRSEDEARIMLKNLTVSTEYAFDDDIPKGYVISQNPPAGRGVRVNDPIIIVVSKGKETVSIPNVEGKPEENAIKLLTDNGFKVISEKKYCKTAAQGNVISQSPTPGTETEKATVVSIVVSMGKDKRTIPFIVSALVLIAIVVGLIVLLNSNHAVRNTVNPKSSGEITESENTMIYDTSTQVSTTESITSAAKVSSDTEDSVQSSDNSHTSVSSKTESGSDEQKNNSSQASDKSETEESSNLASEVSHVSVTSMTEENSNQPSGASHTSVTSRTEESSTQSSRTPTIEDSQQESKPQTETKVKVPNVVGKSKSDAISTLKEAGLIISTTESYSDTVASGKVISQSVSSGSSVAKNTTVTITVSKGKKPISVSFDANEGSVNTSFKTVYKGSSYGSLPTPTRDYYDFEGWYTSLSGNTKISSSSTVILDTNHTLYAHWKLKSGILWIEKCGENVTGVFDTNGVLTISGYGRMYDYGNPSFSDGSIVVNGESCIPDWKNDVRTINVEKGITYLGNIAFTEMENLQTVSISNTVKEIGDGTFYECKLLKNITFSPNLKKIGNGSFCGCENIQRLNLPEKLISIGDYAFKWCFSLLDVKLPEGLQSIGTGAFTSCQHIASVTIPSTVSKMGNAVFNYCSRLSSVYIKNKDSAPDSWAPDWIGTYGVEVIWNA